MKRILIASYDMEVGGVERSLISMLENFDYGAYAVDLMLYRHQGDFMSMIPSEVKLLGENAAYATFRMSVGEVVRERKYGIAISRIVSKLAATYMGKRKGLAEPGYYQMQLMWRYALPVLPKHETEYEIAISYLWPHDFVAEKVRAKKKIAWIHTDYSTVETDVALDLKVWDKFDHIVAVSEACRTSFLAKYGPLERKVTVMENITSPEFVRSMARQPVEDAISRDPRFKLVTVARLSNAKGIDQAVHAMKLLYDRGFAGKLAWYVVGYGGDEAGIRELIAQYGLEDSFILLGKKTNPYPYIGACDLYVQPSRYEGKAVTVTEAKILGRPILITNYTTAASQVEDGVDGVICELSVEGIAAGIERLYEDERLRNELTACLNRRDHGNSEELTKLYRLMGDQR
ncbi:glycosyltransferase [Paenibacillus chartarius]|uniref:Glycosyltransferase n=1 Tax=Paenibacillus chartarius TaxID=747481 RepID=A0ABV6DUX8_9BACL